MMPGPSRSSGASTPQLLLWRTCEAATEHAEAQRRCVALKPHLAAMLSGANRGEAVAGGQPVGALTGHKQVLEVAAAPVATVVELRLRAPAQVSAAMAQAYASHSTMPNAARGAPRTAPGAGASSPPSDQPDQCTCSGAGCPCSACAHSARMCPPSIRCAARENDAAPPATAGMLRATATPARPAPRTAARSAW